jgi:hypothetical protein
LLSHQIRPLSEEERRTRTKDIEKRYWDEYTKRGVENVAVIHPRDEG